MASGHVFRPFRRCATLALALFVLVLATDQLEHHDLVCHLKTPQHCSACASSQPGSDPNAPLSAQRIVLADMGGAVADDPLLVGTVLPARSSGRSPPAVPSI